MKVSLDVLTAPRVLLMMRTTMLASCDKPDSCIASSIVYSGVVRQFGYEAQVFPVRTSVLNAVFSAWYAEHGGNMTNTTEEDWTALVERGGRLVVIGDDEHDPAEPGKWAGHLVSIVHDRKTKRRWLVDLTIDQAHRPQRGIVMEGPLAGSIQGVWERFRSGEGQMVQERPDGVVVIYEPRPQNLGYHESGDWIHRRERYDPYIAGMTAAIKDTAKDLARLR